MQVTQFTHEIEDRFFDIVGDNHRIDKGGNHFINGKCVNPQLHQLNEIGDTHIPKEERVYRNIN